MPVRIQDCEDVTLRAQWVSDEGTHYLRTFFVHPDQMASLPAEGDALPGEASTLLGPFIPKGGIQVKQKQSNGGKMTVQIRGLLLKARE
jgi:hypothetical protein